MIVDWIAAISYQQIANQESTIINESISKIRNQDY
jgi:hypothetical protein